MLCVEFNGLNIIIMLVFGGNTHKGRQHNLQSFADSSADTQWGVAVRTF